MSSIKKQTKVTVDNVSYDIFKNFTISKITPKIDIFEKFKSHIRKHIVKKVKKKCQLK